MSLSSNLIPSRETHSITEAVLSLFLVQPLIKPARFKEMISEGQAFHSIFQQFQVQKQFQLSAKIDITEMNTEGFGNLNKTEPEDVGFFLLSFKEGKQDFVIRYNTDGQQHVLSIHTLQYERWNSFIEMAQKFIFEISKFYSGIFINSVGLTYIDQFNWVSTEPLKMNMIFNECSYLPTLIQDSIGDWNYTFGHTIEKENKLVFEHINLGIAKVAVNNLLLTLSHNVAQGFQEEAIGLNEDNTIENIVTGANFMHALNKEFFKACLKQEILNMVHIN